MQIQEMSRGGCEYAGLNKIDARQVENCTECGPADSWEPARSSFGGSFAQIAAAVRGACQPVIPALTSGGVPEITARKIKKETPLYTIDAEFPRMTGFTDGTVEKAFNRAVAAMAGEKVRDFRAAAKSTPPVNGMSNGLDLGFSVAFKNDTIVSLTMADCQFYAGAAHPSHDMNTFNFDLKKGSKIELFDLFDMAKKDHEISDIFRDLHEDYLERGFPILKRLSDYCKSDLARQGIESSWLDDGAGPKEMNFRNFNVTDKGLIINFNEYQVASYAEGPQVVEIPYEALADLLNPQGPLGDHAKPLPEPPDPLEKKGDPPVVEDELGMIIIDGLRLPKR
jgi:hypothetical protein